jgi:alpha-ribazole phosphatase
MTLWLVRHAQPVVAAGVCYGSTDMPADVAATQAAAQALALVLPQRLQVVTSPLQRCEQLIQCLRGLRADLTVKIDPRLVEMNFGTWEGQPWDAIPRQELDAWTGAFETWRCGGGECVQDVMQRVSAAWDEVQAHHQVTGQPTVWITHAGVIRSASLISQGVRQVALASQWPKDAPGFGEWWCV